MVRAYKGAFSGEHGDGLVRSEWVAWQFGPRLTRAFEEIKDAFDPAGLMNPGKIVRADADGRRVAVPLSARLSRRRRSRPRSTGRRGTSTPIPVTDDADAARHRRRSRAGLRQGRGDVQQQRPLPQVRRRHDVPELSRHARRGALDARPRQHAAARAVGPARRRTSHPRAGARSARPLRELQGMPARMPDRRRHGADEDRVPASLAAQARAVAQGPADRVSAALGAVGGADAVAAEPARHGCPAPRGWASAGSGFAAQRSLPTWRRDTFLRRDGKPRDADSQAARRPERRTSCCSSTRSPTISSRRTRTRRSRCCVPRAMRWKSRSPRRDAETASAALLRPHVPERGAGRRSEGRGAAHGRRAAAACRARRGHRRAWSLRASFRCATNFSSWAWAMPRSASLRARS